MTTRLPGLDQPISLALSGDLSYRARVEQVGDGVLSVSGPLGADVPTPEPGAPLRLFWVHRRMRYVIPVHMVGVAGPRPWRWTLRPAGDPQAETRRRFIRGGGGGPVQLWRPQPAGPAWREGLLLDVSEGGLRGRLPAEAFDRGESLQIRAWLGTDEVAAAGEVLSVRPHTDPGWLDLVVEYELGEQAARRLRRYLLAWEVDQRRRERGDGRARRDAS